MRRSLWAIAFSATIAFAAQTALAETRLWVARYVLTALLLLAATFWAQRGHPLRGYLPEPTVLALSGLAGLSVWAPAWWLMDMANYALERSVGVLRLPLPVLDVREHWFGVNMQPLAYELGVLFAVLIVPLLSAWLLWGLAQPALEANLGRKRALWLGGAVGGVFWTLIAPQSIAPAIPWGLAALPGYLLIGWVAVLMATLSGSAWAGFAAQFAFAYATFAWRDDLFRAFAGKSYTDPAWLTVLVLGAFGVFFLAQVIRARTQRPPEPTHTYYSDARAWWALALLLSAVIALTALDVQQRHETRAINVAALPPTLPTAPTPPAP